MPLGLAMLGMAGRVGMGMGAWGCECLVRDGGLGMALVWGLLSVE